MNYGYLVPIAESSFEEIIKKSRFISFIAPVQTVEQAKQYIGKIKKQYSDARHHCWAYQIGPPDSKAEIGMSDDGEPHGTAGKPMLNILLHAPFGDAVVVVVRYFGGVKLGTGGLVKAYSNGIKQIAQEIKTVMKIKWATFDLTMPYNCTSRFLTKIESFGINIEKEVFAQDVTYTIVLPENNIEDLKVYIGNLTLGKAIFTD